VIPLDAGLVKGSHGVCPASANDHPVIVVEDPALLPSSTLSAGEVYRVLKAAVEGGVRRI